MRFGERVRDLRTSKGLSQRALGKQIGVSFTYISKIENEKLDFGDYPSELLICRIAEVLETDRDEMLLLAKKIPEPIRRRVFERPEVFRALLGAMTRHLTVYWQTSAPGRHRATLLGVEYQPNEKLREHPVAHWGGEQFLASLAAPCTSPPAIS